VSKLAWTLMDTFVSWELDWGVLPEVAMETP
jgi:hypothetical protein